MRKTLKEALRVGVATSKYPFAPIKTPEDLRGKPEYNKSQCICCAACAVACPPNAIQVYPDIVEGTIKWEIDLGRCIFCGRCEEVCPTRAIWLGPEFELAVMNRNDLVEDAEFELAQCEQCGKYFAPKKQIDYLERLYETMHPNMEHANAIQVAAAKDLHICTECKAKNDGLRRSESLYDEGGR